MPQGLEIMSVRVELLSRDTEGSYAEFLNSFDYTLLYTSLAYRNFLKRILTESQDFYLVAFESEQIVGALPCFIKNSSYGNVLNSLPFYGSNGGVIVSPQASDKEAVKISLIRELYSLASEKSVVVSTIVSNPLNADPEFYEAHTHYTLRDQRIGQITLLSNVLRGQNPLIENFHPKTRNSIRKAQKSGISVEHSESKEAIEMLATVHRQNIEAIGGRFKSIDVFMAIRESFAYDQDYRVYIARKDGIEIAALLVFFHNRTTEYFTPAIVATHRVYQPMSLLIYEAMQEAVRRGCCYWNWGGTWLTQDGVYQFKSRWGTQDMAYHYYIREHEKDHAIRKLSRDTLLAEYPNFFVVPFDFLENP
jgi:Acetyltransferase (GNAT) domain